jgi:cytochrome aa3-600 menaquinol oxidase subunit I
MGFGFTFEWFWMGIVGMIGVVVTLFARSFQYDTDYYISVEEIERTERALRRSIPIGKNA